MLYKVSIRLKKAALGNCKSKGEDVVRFRKDGDHSWEQDLDFWTDSIASAIRELHMDVDPESIRMPPTIALGRTIIFRRLYRLDGDSRSYSKEHEAIPRNYVISFYVRTVGPQSPDQQQLHRIIAFIGEYEGLSEWGRGRGHGRFSIESLDSVGRGDPVFGELSLGVREGTPVHDKKDGEGAG